MGTGGVPLTVAASKDALSVVCVNILMVLERALRREGFLAVGTAEHFARVAVAEGIT